MSSYEAAPTTQSVLCCLGQSVGGKATQFLMERAFEAADLDWRVITTEVTAADFPAALAGISAMRFNAIEIFPSLQAEAARLLDSKEPAIEFLGAVSSAMRSGQSWQAWHSWGHGVTQALSNVADLGDITLLALGYSLEVRSLIAALSKHPSPPTTLWVCELNCQELAPAFSTLKIFDAGRMNNLDPAWDELRQCIGAAPDSLALTGDAGSGQWDAFIDPDCLPDRLIIIGEALARRISDRASPNGTEQAAKLHALLNVATVLIDADIHLHANAYSFSRWTGLTADLNILHDAFEEYCDF